MGYQIILGLVIMLFSLNTFAEECLEDYPNLLPYGHVPSLLKIIDAKCETFPLSSAPKISLNLVPSTATLGARFELTFTSKMEVKDIAALKKTFSADFLNSAASMVETVDSDMKQKVEVLTSDKDGYSTVSRNTRSPFPTKAFYSKCDINKETETEFESVCKFDDSRGDSKDYVTSYKMIRKCKKVGEAFSCSTIVVMAPKPVTRFGIEFASTNEVVQKGSLRAVRSLVAQSLLVNSKDKTEAMTKYKCNDFETKIKKFINKAEDNFVMPAKFTY